MPTIECKDPVNRVTVFQAGFRDIFISIPFAATGKTFDSQDREIMTFKLTEEQAKFVLSSLGKIYYPDSLNRIINDIST